MRQTFSLLRNNMDVSKEKITNRKELEEALSFVIVDDWLSFPYDKNLTLDENVEKYKEHVRIEKMKMVEADFDICLDEEDALNNSEHK